jgi:hypothetical protein
MADPNTTAEDLDQIDANAEEEAAGATTVEAAGESAAVEGEQTEQAANDEELIVTLGEEPEAGSFDDDDIQVKGLTAEQTAAFVRMRQQKAEAKRKLRALEAQAQVAAPPQQVVIGDEPSATDYDMWDADGQKKFQADWTAWSQRKVAAEDQQRQRAQAEQAQQQHWQTRIDAVSKAATSLKVADQDVAQQVFEDAFSIVQQGIIIGGPDDAKTSALLRYALGKNPKKAHELGAILSLAWRQGIVLAAFACLGYGCRNKPFVLVLVVIPQGKEEFGLPAKMVIEAANAGTCAGHDVRDARIRKAVLNEHGGGRIQQIALGGGGPGPLPGACSGGGFGCFANHAGSSRR